jgi:hypothetical protein
MAQSRGATLDAVWFGVDTHAKHRAIVIGYKAYVNSRK